MKSRTQTSGASSLLVPTPCRALALERMLRGALAARCARQVSTTSSAQRSVATRRATAATKNFVPKTSICRQYALSSQTVVEDKLVRRPEQFVVARIFATVYIPHKSFSLNFSRLFCDLILFLSFCRT